MSELTQLRPAGQSRFRPGEDWFVHTVLDSLAPGDAPIHRVVVGTNAERVLDTLHAMCVYLDPAVDVAVSDRRSGARWEGALLALPDVRETVGRLRLPLASYGGVELSVYTGDDQLTLTAELLLVVHARTDRWTFLLDELGFVERADIPRPTWRLADGALRPANALFESLVAAANRLGLQEVAIPVVANVATNAAAGMVEATT